MRHPRGYIRCANMVLTVALVTNLGACDSDADSKQAKEGDKSAAGTGADAKPTPSNPSVGRVFEKDQSKRACEMLPAALVAKTLDVPEAELEVLEIAGCRYSWESADKTQVAEASLAMIWVRKDADTARSYFENMTTNRTAEELRGQMAKVQDTAKQDEKIDTAAKAEVVDQVGGALSIMIPDGGHQFEDVPGIGDAARVLVHDGTMTVLLGNMVFNVKAFKGEASPALDTAGAVNLDQMMAAAKVAETKWLDSTRTQRKQQAIELGKAIVAGI